MLTKNTILIFFILLSFSKTIQAKEQRLIKPKEFVVTPLKSLGKPFHFSKSFLTKAGLISSGVIISSFADKWIQKSTQDGQNKLLNNFFDKTTILGNRLVAPGIATVLTVSGLVKNNNYLANTGIQAVEAFGVSAVFTLGTKLFFGRHRPYDEETNEVFKDNKSFKGIGLHDEVNQSFTSGHSAAIWSVSTVIAHRYDNFFVKSTTYSAASLVSFARFYNNKHWFSDVVAGSLIGYLSALSILEINENDVFIKSSLTVLPTQISSNSFGLLAFLRF